MGSLSKRSQQQWEQVKSVSRVKQDQERNHDPMPHGIVAPKAVVSAEALRE